MVNGHSSKQTAAAVIDEMHSMNKNMESIRMYLKIIDNILKVNKLRTILISTIVFLSISRVFMAAVILCKRTNSSSY